jgi:hypothetical protein
VERTNRLFSLPAIQHSLDVLFGGVARLRGFDLTSGPVKRGQPFTLTLYWQAENATPLSVDYAVFAHLLDPQNSMVAQHDGPPASGEWPTTGWVSGQVIVDAHELAFRDATYQGEAVLEVGLYDRKTFQRLRTADGEDRLVLPLRVTIGP